MAGRRHSGVAFVGGALLAATTVLSGCSDDEPATADDLVCGILDRSAMETITGDLVVAADGEMVPATQRKKGSECEVGRNGRLLLDISLRDFEDEADRTAAIAKATESRDSLGCTDLTDAVGYSCRFTDQQLGDKTGVIVVFDDRQVAVHARTPDRTITPKTEDVLAIARNVDANITAYDAAR
ncbi:hypothetical protein KV102_01050 [Mumia sp. zg.B53]|uniref:hypothetical protein n=1 Tax=unclassified Mumia TaxID=2621872 RepID=UPI001C6E2CFB|nr:MULTISPECIES: hypothetical protein [unclassified Mumia]MBW9205195.1 hypothetical protein [Mumia sp. zg.B17]MBW9208804.1 hypothetical protein [Mumia sp. zg.B21]MBW9213415.1 hypothetical protein [Mumia sp. zg.B53]MDD9349472.1 hypothetical protein [Mumia sp.]